MSSLEHRSLYETEFTIKMILHSSIIRVYMYLTVI